MQCVQVLRVFEQSRAEAWPLLRVLHSLGLLQVEALEVNLGARATLLRGQDGVCLLETHAPLARHPVMRDFDCSALEEELACGRVCITREEEFCRILAGCGVQRLHLALGTGECTVHGLGGQVRLINLLLAPGCPAGQACGCHGNCRRLQDPWARPA
jgi:hypothetical protein